MLKMIQPGLACIGKVVIGERGSKAPVKFDHFVVKSLYQDKDGNLIPDRDLMKRLGEKPKSLKIRLPFNDIEMCFRTSLSYYRSRRLFCSGDGEYAERLEVLKQGDHPQYGPKQPFGPCGSSCPDFQDGRCKPYGVLSMILEEQQQIGGLYTWRTTSWNSIRNVLSGLTMIKAQTGGILAWVPLTMRLVPQTVQPQKGGPPNTAYIVQIVYEGSPQELLTTVRDLLALRSPLLHEIRALESSLKALPQPEESAEDAAETQEEFYPDLSDVGPPTGLEPPRAQVERPTAEQINGLILLAQSCGIDREAFANQVRAHMSWPDDVTLTKKYLRESLTIADYQELWTMLSNRVHDDEEPIASRESVDSTTDADVPDFDGAETASKAVLEGNQYAGDWQLEELRSLAERVGDQAYADVQDMLEHHVGGLPIEVWQIVCNRLRARLEKSTQDVDEEKA